MAFSLSVAVSLTANVPAAENVWVATLAVDELVPLVGSPKSHATDLMLPSASLLASVKVQSRSVQSTV